MRATKGLLILALGACVAGCGGMFGRDRLGADMSDDVAMSVRRSVESNTLSRLAALERSLNDFIQAKGRIPVRLNELIPKYLAEIPEVELGLRREHKDRNDVAYYPVAVISDGQINGALIEDTGGWGYVFNESQVIVFVDCTHKRMDGSYWYKTRGVF
ncbi:hypothetical protein ACFL2T_03745 [Elusimicrobiota bacterium]